jgi:hypothetical protein
MMDESPEMDERCLALLHAARIGDSANVSRIGHNITFLYAYAGLRPSRAGMENLMHILLADKGRKGTLGHLVGVEEAADYDPRADKVKNQEKAEAAYLRWRNEKRP